MMHGDAVVSNDVDNGFSPWEEWSLEEDVCFHERISKYLKDGSLSIDGVAAIVLQLLTKANNTALALLKEVRYVDSSWTHEVNAHALVTAQRRILEARNLLLKGRSDTVTARFPIEPPGGTRMLRLYRHIAYSCYAAAASLNTFYQRFEIWLHGNDKKYCHVAQILVLLSNALDAMMQCHALVYPAEYTILDEKDLDSALNRANVALRITINALNAVSIPEEDAGMVLAEKSALLINTAVLVSTIKLLDMAARHAFATYKETRSHNPHNHIGVIKRCCILRVQILRAKSESYARIAQKNESTQQMMTCEIAIWALDHLHDEIDAISHGMYDSERRDLCYTTEISMDIAECVTALTLLRLAYSRAGREHSTLAKTLERYDVMTKDIRSRCGRLDPCEQDSVTELHDMLERLEFVRGELVAIDKSKLLHTPWSSRVLSQAIQALARAFNTCESALRRAESGMSTSDNISRYASNDLFNTLRSVLFRALLDSAFNIEIDCSALGALFLSGDNNMPSSEYGPATGGGGYSESEPSSGNVTPPDCYVEYVIAEPVAEHSITEIERSYGHSGTEM
ncbi:hypothetical protein PGW94_01040 [Candidatus Anaplasma sp. TIGMIC]|nr:hypothetical protein [Candidatus Anaplasma sp. TIGMIC]